jgi:hypothetical protein
MTAKPLFRWTIGPTVPQGVHILIESVRMTMKTFGVNAFDWMICYNNISTENLSLLKKGVEGRPIHFFKQNWDTCPIEDEMQSPQRDDGSFEWNGNRTGGTLWKACPARMRMETHEIVMDNDIVLLQKLKPIEDFLAANDKVLILEEPIRFYGRYDHLFPESETGPFLNSGLMGFYPGYDFAKAIRNSWEHNGKFARTTQADEQGLLMYTLSRSPSVRIDKTQIVEILARDFKQKPTGREGGIHFTQANRVPNHKAWGLYQQLVNNNVGF